MIRYQRPSRPITERHQIPPPNQPCNRGFTTRSGWSRLSEIRDALGATASSKTRDLPQ